MFWKQIRKVLVLFTGLIVVPYGNKWSVKISLGPLGWGTSVWESFGEMPVWNGRWIVQWSSVCCCFEQTNGGVQVGVNWGVVEVAMCPLVGDARISESSLLKWAWGRLVLSRVNFS